MRLKFMFYSIVTLLVTMLLTWTNPVSAADREVVVTGRAPIVGGNVQAAKNAALKDAFRQAVEKGVGIWIKADTEVKENTVVRDRILSDAQGYVTSYNILDEGKTNGTYFVTVQAMVAVDKIGHSVKDLIGQLKTQMDSPRISFVLTTWGSGGNKLADSTIISSFNQEFTEKGFDLTATDRAMEIALTPAIDNSFIRDRIKIREMAVKDGANYIARGELRVLNVEPLEGDYRVTVQVEAEIIDINSGENIASVMNNFSAVNANAAEARSNAIKKASIGAARILAGQTMENWKNRSQTGRMYTIEIQNISSMTGQKLPFLKVMKEIASGIIGQSSPTEGSFAVTISYGGSKDDLMLAIYEVLQCKPGFTPSEMDGPYDEGGKLVYKFK
jgi:hypothetical protein